MAEELQFPSRSEHKRKFDDRGAYPDSTADPPPPRRQTGFSAPIVSPPSASDDAPLSSYNAVPLPLDGFQLAKQRAQAIAARLLNDAEAKRPRVDNDEDGDDAGGRDFVAPVNDRSHMHHAPPQQKTYAQVNYSNPAPFAAQTVESTCRRIEIPNARVGAVIGRGGETIKYLQLQSGAKIQVTRYADADPYSQTRTVELTGTAEQIDKAEQLVHDVLQEAEVGSSGPSGGQRFGDGHANSEQFMMKVPNNKVGLVIGKGGESIKSMQAKSGARIQVIPLHLPPGDYSAERTVQIDGTKEQVESAKQLVNEVISENRMRNAPGGGGYPHRGYQQLNAGPASWGGPPGPPQPPAQQLAAYGYYPPGAYAGYPPPPPAAAAYPGYWDHHQQLPSATSYQAYGPDDGGEPDGYGAAAAQSAAGGYYFGGYDQYQSYAGHDVVDQFQVPTGGDDDDNGDESTRSVDLQVKGRID
ncbi:uncharacterized protein LOC144700590 [Wolffia australiana]